MIAVGKASSFSHGCKTAAKEAPGEEGKDVVKRVQMVYLRA
jgi:hypothetical protein